uniref:Carboxylic ester hydrolase n=1 Tax=Stegobium paniceum TaxID=295656 RepID=A0A1C8MSL9_STEPN|nr:carboxylesterase [Stegobium paniceum]
MILFGLLVSFLAHLWFVRCLPEVTIPLGKIVGFYGKTENNRIYSAFTGIPYAKPPIGDLRFQEPQDIKDPWKGVIVANTTAICLQITHWPEPEGGYLDGQEDCLIVNVYVPNETPIESTNYDVIVNIHGGGLNFGSSFCYVGEKYLMEKDVVYVTFNYRLGVLGFLSTEDDVVPGNNGMKDQSLALKWIKNNIKYFGGNPNSITITGLSAGGASVHYHYLSPLSKGLFNRGISVSGTALCPWTLQEASLEKARTLGVSLGCDQLDTKKLIECIKQRPATQIVQNTHVFKPWLFNPFSPFGVVVEKPSKTAFISKHPYELLSSGAVQDLPWLNSITSDEGLYPAADYVVKDHYLPDLERRWLELAPFVLDYNYTISPDQKNKISEKIKNYYLHGEPISRKTYHELVQMIGDRHFVIPAEKATRMQAKVNKAPIYFYYFTYNGNAPIFAAYYSKSNENLGVGHGQDLVYILSNQLNPSITVTDKTDLEMKEIFLNMWKTFASTGIPVIPGIKWSQVATDVNAPLDYLHIKSPSNIVMEKKQEMGHRKFWESIPFKEDEKLSSSGKDEL